MQLSAACLPKWHTYPMHQGASIVAKVASDRLFIWGLGHKRHTKPAHAILPCVLALIVSHSRISARPALIDSITVLSVPPCCPYLQRASGTLHGRSLTNIFPSGHVQELCHVLATPRISPKALDSRSAHSHSLTHIHFLSLMRLEMKHFLQYAYVPSILMPTSCPSSVNISLLMRLCVRSFRENFDSSQTTLCPQLNVMSIGLLW